MSHAPMKVGLFTSFGPLAWLATEDRLYGGDWWTGDAHIALVKRLEAAALDFVFFEDTLTVSRAAGGTMDADLKGMSLAPKHDVFLLLAALAKATENIGLFATASTTFVPPWMLARSLSTLDSMSGGRIGWNVVTTGEETSAQNFGMSLPEHDKRYQMADEYLEVVTDLWDGWAPDALVRDIENDIHVDPTKVRETAHRGEYFSVLGPLNTLRSPQGRPVIIQAGSSEAGREFASKHAEVVFAPMQGGVAGMKEFRDDMRARAVARGRSADSIKIIWAAFVNFEEPAEKTFEQLLSFWSGSLDHDLTQHDYDKPFPADLEPTGHTGFFRELQELGQSGMSLRDALMAMGTRVGEGQVNLTGTPEEIAASLIAANDEVGGDGYMFMSSYIANEKYLDLLLNQLVPLLQEAGVMQSAYAPGTARERLFTTA